MNPQVLVQVLLHISSPKDRRSVSLACRSWNQCMNDHRLWRTVRVHLPTVCTLHSRQWSLLSLRHTSRVSLGSLSHSTLPRILRKMAHHLPALLFLGLELRKTGKKPTSYDLNILSDFNNLEELTIQGCQISIHFSSLPALKRLVIQNRVEAKFSVELPNLEALSMVLEQNDALKMEYFKSVRLLCLTRSVLSCRSFAADEPHTGTFPTADEPHTRTFPTADEPHAGTFPTADERHAGTFPTADEPHAGTFPTADEPHAGTFPTADEPHTGTFPTADEPHTRTFPTADDPHTGTFPSVEHLDISYSQLSWGTKIFFTKFSSLFFLSVAHCDLSERDLLIMVEVLTQLRELILTGIIHTY